MHKTSRNGPIPQTKAVSWLPTKTVAHTNCALPERRAGTAASLTLHGEKHGLADVCPNPIAGLAQVIADVFF